MDNIRRDFLKQAGLVVIAVTIGEKGFSHEDGHLASMSEEMDLLIIQSGPGRLVKWDKVHHHHYIEIPVAALINPPAEGIVVATNWQKAHFHRLDISQEQLQKIAQGELVVMDDRSKDHEWHLQLPENMRPKQQ